MSTLSNDLRLIRLERRVDRIEAILNLHQPTRDPEPLGESVPAAPVLPAAPNAPDTFPPIALAPNTEPMSAAADRPAVALPPPIPVGTPVVATVDDIAPLAYALPALPPAKRAPRLRTGRQAFGHPDVPSS